MLLGQKLEGGRRIDPANGLIMPWYTSPCLEWLKTLDLKDKSVFEYGVGDSTLWYRSKESYVSGVENNYDWYVKAADGSTMYKTLYQEYVSSVSNELKAFDIIVIDGAWRDACTEYALYMLSKGGILIIDNWKQKSADLEHWPLTEKLIEGMPITIYKEPDHEDWATAVITKV